MGSIGEIGRRGQRVFKFAGPGIGTSVRGGRCGRACLVEAIKE
jgi:hypothetical protein